mmetsp:Transcript_144332/g.204089  ORF Transcript_144332/g.204089 Transcript_144332/m.204089 type:complete len:236 (-) Transcript_144332:15-722(-)
MAFTGSNVERGLLPGLLSLDVEASLQEPLHLCHVALVSSSVQCGAAEFVHDQVRSRSRFRRFRNRGRSLVLRLPRAKLHGSKEGGEERHNESGDVQECFHEVAEFTRHVLLSGIGNRLALKSQFTVLRALLHFSIRACACLTQEKGFQLFAFKVAAVHEFSVHRHDMSCLYESSGLRCRRKFGTRAASWPYQHQKHRDQHRHHGLGTVGRSRSQTRSPSAKVRCRIWRKTHTGLE